MKFRHILRVILLMAAFGFAAFSALPASAATHANPLLLQPTGVITTALFDEETSADPADPATAEPAEPADPAEPSGN